MRQQLTLAALLALAGFHAWLLWFIQDDAYIAFRYARHFAQGQGLTWYPDSTEYGYTSFLFTLLVGLIMKAGLHAEPAAYGLSIPAFALSIVTAWSLGRRTMKSPFAPPLCAFLLAIHTTFAGYATGGLETSLQTCLVLLAYSELLHWFKKQERAALGGMAVFSTLALLTRLDSAILLFPAYVGLLVAVLPSFSLSKPKLFLAPMLLAAGPPFLAVSALLAGCAYYYGHPLPNSFYVKMDDGTFWPQGMRYILFYNTVEGGVPLALFVCALAALMAQPRQRGALGDFALLWPLPVLLWLVYILCIGGDFMEFRLLVPVLPFFYLFCVNALLCGSTGRTAGMIALATACAGLAATAHHRQTFLSIKMDFPSGVESFESLSKWTTNPALSWITAGRSLRRLFYSGGKDDVLIATTAAGALSYFSGLPVLDELGLNSRGVLHHAKAYEGRAGHRFIAELSYMIAQNVNILVGHPKAYCKPPNIRRCPYIDDYIRPDPYKEPPEIFLPLSNGCYLPVVYLNYHPRVDALLKRGVIVCSRPDP